MCMVVIDVSCIVDNELINFLMNMTQVFKFWNKWLADLCCSFTLFCKYIVVSSWNIIQNIIKCLFEFVNNYDGIIKQKNQKLLHKI